MATKLPPKNPIIPQKYAERLEQKLDGIIVDQDIQGVELNNIRSGITGQGTWNWIRDIIIILLLVLGIGFLIWRAYTFDHAMRACFDSPYTTPAPQG